MSDDPRRERREILERAAERHRDLPDDMIRLQIAKVDEAVELLGGDPELNEAAELAVDRNLQTVRTAIEEGAILPAGPAT